MLRLDLIAAIQKIKEYRMKHDSRLQYFLPLIGCCGLFLGSQIVVDLVFAVVYSLVSGASAGSAAELDAMLYDKLMEWSNPLSLMSYAIVFAGLLLWAKKKKAPFFAFVDLRPRIGAAVGSLSLLAGISANFWFGLMVSLIPWPEAWVTSYESAASVLSAGDLGLELLTVVIMAPLVEEIIFRGLIYRYMTLMVPAGAAVVLQGLLFGGMHGTMIWMLYASVLGCILGYIRRRTGSVRATVLMHIGFNGGSYLFSLFADRWSESDAAILWTLVGSAALFLLVLYGIYYRTGEQEGKAA